jgi:predicted metal-dependent phosphoesterase TrpH
MESREVKGIIHCHSTYSYDAKLSLCELKELCQKNGISFVCMTEHTDELTSARAEEFIKECEALSDSSFLFIPGFEVPYKIHGAHDHAHILMIGTRTYHEQYAPTIEVLKHWTEDASFVILAHPVRNQFLVDDGLLSEIDALEVWNQQYEGKRVPRTRSLKLFEQLRKLKPELRATGGVDFHRKEHMGAPLVSLTLDSLSEASIIEKLKEGAYTFSSEQAMVYGTLPNVEELVKKHRFESFVSVSIIVLGKCVNKTLATFGLKLPKSLKEAIRKRL